MRLSRDSIEYAHWTFTGAPDDAPPPEVELNGTWHPMTWVDFAGPVRSARILIAGPAAPNPGTAVVLGLGRTTARVRIVDNPETVIRDGGGTIEIGD